MEVNERAHRYIEWISPADMHRETLEWLSELNFIEDEQLFINGLVKHYTSFLAETAIYPKSKVVVANILKSEKELSILKKKVILHENQLGILTDDVDQPKMEQAYKETHRELMKNLGVFMKKYRLIKKELFEMISLLMRKDKEKRLLN